MRYRVRAMPAVPLTVAEIMSRQPVVVTPDDTVRRVLELFTKYGFHHLPVVEHEWLLGIISDRDVLKHISPFVGMINERIQDAATLDRRAHQVMTRKLVTVREETPIADAARLMLDRRVSCLPVVRSESVLCGIVTSRDLLRAGFAPAAPQTD